MSQLLFPYYQPIVEVSTGRVVGHEVLARCRAPGNKVIAAGYIFSDDATPIEIRRCADRTVRKQALTHYATSDANQFLSLNISPEWIDQLATLDQLPTLDMIRELGVNPGNILIEITEIQGSLTRIVQLSERYRQSGMRVAFDDFGSGFQQIDRLLAFTPDVIKLDLQTFRNSASPMIGESTMLMIGEMAQKLGCEIICEGVETDQDLALALRCGAQYIQGYLFAPALPDFSPTYAQAPKMASLLSQLFENAMQGAADRRLQAENLRLQVLEIASRIATSGLDWLGQIELNPNIIRCFLCNEQGVQTSPNYERTGAREWTSIDDKIGNNWSWRPYIQQSIGLQPHTDRVFQSSVYRDIFSGKACYTLAYPLEDNSILLVDVRDKAPSSAPAVAVQPLPRKEAH